MDIREIKKYIIRRLNDRLLFLAKSPAAAYIEECETVNWIIKNLNTGTLELSLTIYKDSTDVVSKPFSCNPTGDGVLREEEEEPVKSVNEDVNIFSKNQWEVLPLSGDSSSPCSYYPIVNSNKRTVAYVFNADDANHIVNAVNTQKFYYQHTSGSCSVFDPRSTYICTCVTEEVAKQLVDKLNNDNSSLTKKFDDVFGKW